MTTTLDAAYFARYDALCQELQHLQHADQALAAGQQALARLAQSEAEAEQSVKSNARSQRHRREVIDRCERHWFFSNTLLQPQTWLKGGVDGKLERQKVKLARAEQMAPDLAKRERDLEQQLAQMQVQVADLAGSAARKKAATDERLSLFEAAVAAAPSPQLRQQQRVVQGLQSTLQVVQQDGATMAQVEQRVQGARQQYHGAMRSLQRAEGTNRSAQFNNAIDGSELLEHVQQEQRNQMMQQAQHLASRGTAELQQAFSIIPPALRQRHPQLCAQLGSVVLPQLEQMGVGGTMLEYFGGDVGDAVAGMQASRKIHHNMQILASCERTIAQQEALVQGLLQAVRTEGQVTAASLQNAELQMHAEKQRIFDGLRLQWGVASTDAQLATVQAQAAASTVQAAWRGKGGVGQGDDAATVGQHAGVAVATAVPVGAPVSPGVPVGSAVAPVPAGCIAAATPLPVAAAVPAASQGTVHAVATALPVAAAVVPRATAAVPVV